MLYKCEKTIPGMRSFDTYVHVYRRGFRWQKGYATGGRRNREGKHPQLCLVNPLAIIVGLLR